MPIICSCVPYYILPYCCRHLCTYVTNSIIHPTYSATSSTWQKERAAKQKNLPLPKQRYQSPSRDPPLVTTTTTRRRNPPNKQRKKSKSNLFHPIGPFPPIHQTSQLPKSSIQEIFFTNAADVISNCPRIRILDPT